jgi:hypothetical protein
MAIERYEVVKFDKRTGKESEPVFSTLSRPEAKQKAAKSNDELTRNQRQQGEFRVRRGNPFYRFSFDN